MANAAAPLAIWFGSALLAAALAHARITSWSPWAVAVCVLGFLGFCTILSRRTLAMETKRRDARAVYLPRALAALEARAIPAPAPGTRELNQADLANLRYALDRGLQPVDGFAGFDVIEQFQTSSIRYQIDYLLWALQVAQCHYTPNFHGYLSRAQRNLIDKLAVPKVWKWWRWESLLGNFSLSVDPIAKDNIMFGGFSSANIALYTANTGDDRYLKPGALSFRWSDTQIFKHDLRSILNAGRRNHETAVYAPLYPCEPKLTYSACNLWGNFAHLTSDRIFSTQYGPELLRKLRSPQMTEMLGLDGSPHAGRMTPLGIRIPVYTCNHVSAIWGWMASAFFPDLSKRTWASLREECVSFDAQGEITLASEAYDRIDTGNYKKSEAGLYAQFLILAREQGDNEVAEAILRKLDRDFDRVDHGHVVSFAKSSNVNNAAIVMGRLLRRGDVRAMVLEGPGAACLSGPLLTEVRYPDVLVAKAWSDGTGLNLVLYPGATPSTQTLTLQRLTPGQGYIVEESGNRFWADDRGHAEIDVFIDGRTVVTITRIQDLS